MDEEENKPKQTKHDCPSCDGSLFQVCIESWDGVKKIGCPSCGTWGDNALTPIGAVNSFRLKMGLEPLKEDD